MTNHSTKDLLNALELIGFVLLLGVVGYAGYLMGHEDGARWLSDQLAYERASDEDKNAFTQCLLTTWEEMEARIDE